MKNFLLLLVCVCGSLPSWALTSITTNRIKGGPFCGGSTVNVSFTIDASANPGNVFTAQLSDKKGSFDSPVNIGTLSSTESGTIKATIPLGTVSSSKYQIRVIASDPSVIGAPSKNAIRINPPPKQLVLSNITACSVVLSWSPVSTADHYQVGYKKHKKNNFLGPIDVSDTTYTFTGLSSSLRYDLLVRAVCSGGDVSSWDSVTVGTATCPVPGNLFVTTIAITTCSLDWPDASCAMDYSFRYRLLGTQTWTYKHPTVSTIDLTGLCPACDYEAQVATRCSESDSSDYGNTSTWEQNYFRIAGDLNSVSEGVYPNPSNGNFILRFNSSSDNSMDVTVQNVYGQIIYHSVQSAVRGLNEESISLPQVGAGMYFVKVQCGDQNFTSSLIVE